VSRTLKEELKFSRSAVTSLDWVSYPILTFPEVPDIVMDLIDRIAAFSVEHRLPSFSTFSFFAEFGGLLAYGPSISKCFRRGGYFTKRILDGANPGDLPINATSQFDFVVNLRTAHALEFALPPDFVSAANEVIE